MTSFPPSYRVRLADVVVDSGHGLTVEFASGGALLGSLVWAAVVAAIDLPPSAAVVGYAVLALVLSWFSTPTSAVLVAGLCVLFADGFALARQGQLTLSVEVLLAFAVGAAGCVTGATAGGRRRRQRHVKTGPAGIKDPSGRAPVRPS